MGKAWEKREKREEGEDRVNLAGRAKEERRFTVYG